VSLGDDRTIVIEFDKESGWDDVTEKYATTYVQQLVVSGTLQ